MSSSFLEQHLALIKGVHDKSIKLNTKKNRKSIVEQVTRDMKQKDTKKEQLLQQLAKPRQKKHSVSEVKTIIKLNRKAQKAPRRKLKEVLVKSDKKSSK